MLPSITAVPLLISPLPFLFLSLAVAWLPRVRANADDIIEEYADVPGMRERLLIIDQVWIPCFQLFMKRFVCFNCFFPKGRLTGCKGCSSIARHLPVARVATCSRQPIAWLLWEA